MEPDAVLIRPAEPADAAGISVLFGAVGTFEGTLQLPDMPIASRIESLQKVDPQSCKLVAVCGERVIGMAFLYSQASLRRNHVRSLAIALAAEWQAKGLGRKLMLRLLDWADNWAGVLRIELTVHAGNEAAQQLYRSLGFVEEGRHRGYALKNGSYVDSISMARLHPRPPVLPA